MNINIDLETLAQITEEARECFLTEDAPEYLQMLEEGLERGKDEADLVEMMRAAHSLKGGAGLAELPGIKDLSHQMENLIEGFKQGSVPRSRAAWEVLERSIYNLAVLLSQAELDQEITADEKILQALASFATEDRNQENVESISIEVGKQKLLQTLLKKDLEESFIKVENLSLEDDSAAKIKENLEFFCDECLVVGDTLELTWLVKTVEDFQTALEELEAAEALELAKEVIENLREQRKEYLGESAAELIESSPKIDSLTEGLLTKDLEESFQKIAELSPATPAAEIAEKLNEFCDESLFIGDTLDLAWLVKTVESLQEAIADLEPQTGLELAKEVIENLREQRKEYLGESAAEVAESSPKIDGLAERLLTQDLEASFQKIAELSPATPAAEIAEKLNEFCEESLFIGDTLDLAWLTETIEVLQGVLKELEPRERLPLVKEKIKTLREHRQKYLAQLSPQEIENELVVEEFAETLLKDDLEASFKKIEELTLETPEAEIKELLENFCDECSFIGETIKLPWLVENIESLHARLNKSSDREALVLAKEAISFLRIKRDRLLEEISAEKSPEILPEETSKPPVIEQSVAIKPKKEPASYSKDNKVTLSHLRVPVKQLEAIGERVNELMLIKEKLRLQQQLLQQTNIRIRQLSRRFEPIREQVQATYDWLAINPNRVTTSASVSHPESLLTDDSSGKLLPFKLGNIELDRFTGLHLSLQNFQELMLRIQETRGDLDLIERELAEDLEEVDTNLNSLYKNVTESRLVPFKIIAKRFIPQVKRLEGMFRDKSVKLKIQGEDTLVDQLLLEQLQTPLTHLLNNAFDHGIETTKERLANDKLKTAEIILQARVDNSQLTIELKDDGKGINLEKIYQKAIERGLCDRETSFEQLREQQIIEFIFQPDFSTAKQVSQISGRGMGLNIVRDRIRRLGGNLSLETQLGQGTKFTLKLPLDLSLVSLLIIEIQEQILALPSSEVLETLLLSELELVEEEFPSVIWHQKEIPLFHLFDLLPYSRLEMQPNHSKIAVILSTSFGPVATTIDTLVSEAELIVKPFENTIPTPTYLGGCTILGSGRVVPFILPQALEQPKSSILWSQETEVKQTANKIPTILVAEDSVGNRRFLERLLTQVGFNVVLCRDGQEALDKLPQLEGQVNLIISDVEMPRLNGFELLYWLRSKPSWSKVPVVMATSRTADRHQQQAMQLGANGYLGKPVQPQELFDTIESLLAFNEE
ncbi:MAG: response regulator [Prochloraceae cyanobacterium]